MIWYSYFAIHLGFIENNNFKTHRLCIKHSRVHHNISNHTPYSTMDEFFLFLRNKRLNEGKTRDLKLAYHVFLTTYRKYFLS